MFLQIPGTGLNAIPSSVPMKFNLTVRYRTDKAISVRKLIWLECSVKTTSEGNPDAYDQPRFRIAHPQFRSCPKCQSPMLLMTAVQTPDKADIITKHMSVMSSFYRTNRGRR